MRNRAWLLALLTIGCGSSSPSRPSGGGSLQCSAAPTSGSAPLTVTFAAEAVGSTGYTLLINYGDGSVGINPNASHVYANAGAYSVNIEESIGGVGVASCSSSISVAAAPPPQSSIPPRVRFHVTPNPATGPVPLDVKFNMCESSDPNDLPLTYTFDFGDGVTARNACREDHMYTQAGQFQAVMCISDPAHQLCKHVVVQAE